MWTIGFLKVKLDGWGMAGSKNLFFPIVILKHELIIFHKNCFEHQPFFKNLFTRSKPKEQCPCTTRLNLLGFSFLGLKIVLFQALPTRV
jgi:hypothetical protein